jgi:hypothetical protein
MSNVKSDENLTIEKVGRHGDRTIEAARSWLGSISSVGTFTFAEARQNIVAHACMMGFRESDVNIDPCAYDDIPVAVAVTRRLLAIYDEEEPPAIDPDAKVTFEGGTHRCMSRAFRVN